MPTSASWIAFALVSLGMVLTPGPNMIYLASPSPYPGFGTPGSLIVRMATEARR